MNHDNKNTNTPIDDQAIDLLVDGELGEEQRRELLAELDVKPGGWRRCALAFLEDQCWRHTCGSINEDMKRQPTTPPPSPELTSPELTSPQQKTPSTPRKSGDQRRRRPSAVARATGALLAMGACIFFGMGLASLIRDVDQKGRPGVSPGGSQQAAMFAATPTNPQDGQLIHDNKNNKVFLPGKYQTVTITAKRPDGTTRSIQLPAVVQNNIDVTRLREIPSAIPPELVRAFAKAGHDVHQSRRLVPFLMKDGRRLVVPVDQLDVHYVSTPYYQ